MVDAPWFAAAALPLLATWILWRAQALAVDRVLRRGMFQLLRWQRRTYTVVSWFGVLLHELSHAALLLLGGHGIREFSVHTEHGHVKPRHRRTTVYGDVTFVLAALAPLYVAPAAILAVAALLLEPDLLRPAVAGPGLEAAGLAVRDLVTTFPLRLGEVLVGLDVTTGPGLAVCLLAVLALPAARPSHVKSEGRSEGDVAVLRATLRDRPALWLSVLALAYGAYFALVPWWPEAYWTAFHVLWATALTAVLLAVVGGLGWWAVAWTGRVRPWAAWLPYAAVVAVQWLGRTHTDLPVVALNLASLAAFGLLAAGLLLVAQRRFA